MLNVLFWNLRRNPLQEFVGRLATRWSLDIIILAESEGVPPATLLSVLNPMGASSYYHVPLLGCEKLEIYVRFSTEFLTPVAETHRLTVRHLQLPGTIDILVAAVHFPDKRSMSGASQAFEAITLAEVLRRAERQVGHQRTILVGDLNMNPFEDGMVGAQALHAIMDRSVARRAERKVQGVSYPYFYNPMWSLFGDASPGPSGTYYYSKAESVVYFWNIFDQVLIRPTLIERFPHERLMILTSDGLTQLQNRRGEPEPEISDHFPIVFSLDL
jgi:endonuclease/exonuclease/phosphatase family metal-dependent hydrolase